MIRDNSSKIFKYLVEKHYIDHLPFISVGIISGIVCCFYAKFFAYAESLSRALLGSSPYIAATLAPVLLCLAFLIINKFAPGASGSGIPQVMVCIDKNYRHASSVFLSLKVIFAKISSSIIAVISGAAIGREGPSIQLSAAIAHNIGRLSKRLNIQVKSEQLLIAGAGSGLAAAFNTPIGGIVYAVEELSHEHLRSFKDTLLLSVVIAGFTAQAFLGNYLYLGYPKLNANTGFTSLLIISGVALICGILGSFFSLLLARFIKWRVSKKITTQIIIVAAVSLLLVGFFMLFGERVVLSGKESINHVLFSNGELPFFEILLRFISPLLSSMTGVAGGIFAPSLSTGAVLGGFASQLFDPTLRTVLGLAGMIGFLTGVTKTPITSFVLVLEMTDRHSFVLPMMFAAVFSSLGSYFVAKKSFYEMSVEVLKEGQGPR